MDPVKKRKLEQEQLNMLSKIDETRRINITLTDNEGNQLGNTFDIPIGTTQQELQQIVRELLKLQQDQRMKETFEDIPSIFSFFVDTQEIKNKISDFIIKNLNNFTSENVLPIQYFQQSLFYVRPITRQSSSLPGHTESVLSVQFSPDSQQLASGAGDTSVRFWDLHTEMPLSTSEAGHTNWVLCIQWSPDSKKLASGGMEGDICIWDAISHKQIGKNLKGHQKFITSLSWEPAHLNKECNLLASSSKDCTIRIWNVESQQTVYILSSHTKCVTKVLWGGQDLIYSCSEDTSIKVWNKNGKMLKELRGHAHWVNTLCCHTDYALRTGGFDEKTYEFNTTQQMQDKALEKYNKLKGCEHERLVSGSDDFTLIMWSPFNSTKPKIRMTGHQQPINFSQFSPDSRFIISASFDKSLRLWDGYTGKYISVFRGHVGPVYQIAFSPDSRTFVSASKDSTMKLWDIKTKKLMFDLPGHADEVFSVDWTPNGQKVVSGGKDRQLKLWKN